MSRELIVFEEGRRQLRGKSLLELNRLFYIVSNIVYGERLTVEALEKVLEVGGLPRGLEYSLERRIEYFSARGEKAEKLLRDIVLEASSKV